VVKTRARFAHACLHERRPVGSFGCEWGTLRKAGRAVCDVVVLLNVQHAVLESAQEGVVVGRSHVPRMGPSPSRTTSEPCRHLTMSTTARRTEAEGEIA